MDEKVHKLIKYVQQKVNYEIQEAATGSVYLFKDKYLLARIANHTPSKSRGGSCIKVFSLDYDKGFCVEINRHLYYYASYQKVGDLLIHKYYIEDCEPELNMQTQLDKAKSQLVHLKQLVDSLQDTLNKVNSEKTSLLSTITELKEHNKTDSYLADLKIARSKASEYKQTISDLEEENKILKNDCEEAADLIQKLTTDSELREMLTTKDKKYFIDNFPEDIQELLMEVIKEYYDS